MTKDNNVYLADILDCIEKCESFTSGYAFEEFYEDELLRLAVLHLVQTIGEAAGCLTPEFRAKHPDFPVSDATAMRNKVVHEYRAVDWDVVWETVQNSLPDLKKKVLEVLDKP